MGLFDTVKIEDRSYQTKALGQGMAVFTAGDPVTIYSRDDALLGFSQGTPTLVKDCQVECLEESWSSGERGEEAFILIKDGKISTVTTERDENLPLLDYYGRPVAQA